MPEPPPAERAEAEAITAEGRELQRRMRVATAMPETTRSERKAKQREVQHLMGEYRDLKRRKRALNRKLETR